MINNILYEMYECDLNSEVVDAVLYMIINSKTTYNSTFHKYMCTHSKHNINSKLYINMDRWHSILTEAVDQLVLHSKC